MKPLIPSAALALIASLSLPSGWAAAEAPFHIGICTEPLDKGPEDFQGAERLVQEYGAAKSGGIVAHVTSLKDLAALAKDPLLKVVVTCQAGPGTAEVYQKIRAKRADVLLLSALSGEEPATIQKAADLEVDVDYLSRGFTIPWGAKQLGATSLVYVSFPRHMGYASLARQRAVMMQACKDLGLAFAIEETPDSIKTGLKPSIAFVDQNVPAWVAKHQVDGGKVAFYATQDGEVEPLLRQILTQPNAVFVEHETPTPLIGFPEATGVKPALEKNDFPTLMKQLEAAVAAKGGAGRVGTWASGIGFTFTAGLGEFGKRIVEGKAQLASLPDLCEALGKFTPGARWNGNLYVDPRDGSRAKNLVMVYSDTYIFGKGFLPSTAQKIPEAYFALPK